jgi:hypothetical protein
VSGSGEASPKIVHGHRPEFVRPEGTGPLESEGPSATDHSGLGAAIRDIAMRIGELSRIWSGHANSTTTTQPALDTAAFNALLAANARTLDVPPTPEIPADSLASLPNYDDLFARIRARDDALYAAWTR